MYFGRSGGDDLAKIPFTVVPVRAGTSEKITEIGTRLIPYPHLAAGQPIMRKVQCREQSRFIASI